MGRPRTAKHPKAAPPPEPEDESQEEPEEEPEAEDEPEPAPKAAPKAAGGGQTISKAEAVRQALAQGLDSLDDIEDFLKRRHGIEMPRPQISAYKAQAKKKAGEGGAPKARRGRKPRQTAETGHAVPSPAARAKVVPTGAGDLLEALKSLKGLVSTHGADKVKEMVDLLG